MAGRKIEPIAGADSAPAVQPVRTGPLPGVPQPPIPPSFGMCEGVRADLEQVDKTTDPFTGKVVTAEDAK
jgi:hypothetical protein